MLLVELLYSGLEGGIAVEAAGEKEGAGDVVFAKGLCDCRKSVTEFVTGEDEGYGLAGGVASNDRAVGNGPMMAVCCLGLLSGKEVYQRCRAIHGRLIRAVIPIIIMIDGEAALKFLIGILMSEPNANEMIKDGGIHRSVDQAPIDGVILQMCKSRMGVGRRVAIGGQPIDHAGAPEIATKSQSKQACSSG